MMKVINLFAKEPTWSVRGDRELWNWLKENVNPDKEVFTKDEAEAYILGLVRDKTGHKWERSEERITVPSLKIGHGLSDGEVNIGHWFRVILPFLTGQI